MLAIKGFISHALMAQNNPGQNALIAELSTHASTFAREKGYYGSLAAQHYELTTFLAEKDGVPVKLTGPQYENVLDIAKYVLDKTINSTNEMFADELLNDLLTNQATKGESFECGPIVNDGRFYAPEWVSWKAKGIDEVDNYIRIWFVDAAFRLQYDEFEIVVVPALTPLSDFFGPGGSVETKLKARGPVEITTDLQNAKNGHPETIIRIYPFEYIDPLNNAHRVPSNWGVLIYGAAGDNIDAIKDALVAYILANSTQTREQWSLLLPDIFKRTEFLLIPRWDLYAIPNRTVEAGIHSPVSTLGDALAKAVAVIGSGYPSAHINSHAQVLAHPYKSLSVLSVGGPENRDNHWKITDVFSDYIAVPSTSLDFNRMASATKGFALLLADLLLVAEQVGEFTSVPLGMSKVKRNGILYVVKSYDNVHYLVAAKVSIDEPEVVLP